MVLSFFYCCVIMRQTHKCGNGVEKQPIRMVIVIVPIRKNYVTTGSYFSYKIATATQFYRLLYLCQSKLISISKTIEKLSFMWRIDECGNRLMTGEFSLLPPCGKCRINCLFFYINVRHFPQVLCFSSSKRFPVITVLRKRNQYTVIP